MQIQAIINFLETVAHPSLQEGYDNAGLLVGKGDSICTGIVVSLDVTEAVIDEAAASGANLIVAHHPLIFSGLKRISEQDPVGRAVICAIRKHIAVYAIHTNLDNIISGVNGRIAQLLGLTNLRVLEPKTGQLRKFFCFVPTAHLDPVRNALFSAGAGHIGLYDEAGFHVEGTGSFRAKQGANPFVGAKGHRHYEPECKLEVIYPVHLEQQMITALLEAHPYEEVAYDIVMLENTDKTFGSGLVGELPVAMAEQDFLALVKEKFKLALIRHTPLLGQPVKTVALCGGAGSFLISKALRVGAGFYITSDVKYHEFFGADGKIVIADIGHYESEQYTCDLLFERLQEKFLNFAVLKSVVETNPVKYFI
jgi:dinuclear metal center YbgI/SA1388 family protein